MRSNIGHDTSYGHRPPQQTQQYSDAGGIRAPSEWSCKPHPQSQMPPVPTLRAIARRRLLDLMADQLQDAMRIREAVGRFITANYLRGLITDEAIDRVILACDDLMEELIEQRSILLNYLRQF